MVKASKETGVVINASSPSQGIPGGWVGSSFKYIEQQSRSVNIMNRRGRRTETTLL